jgi:hypothetical protein
MDERAQKLIAQHVTSIQEGFERRAAANTSIATAMRDLTLARVSHAQSPVEAQTALNAYVEGMLHW